MNSSPLVTSGLTVSVVQLVPTVDWALAGFHGSPPSNLSTLVAGGIVLILHAGYNWLAARSAAKAPATPAA